MAILEKYFRHLILYDHLLGETPSFRNIHAGGFRYENENKELVTPIKQISFSIAIPVDVVINYDIEKFAVSINDFTQERINKMHRMMFDTIDKVTNLTGNIVNAEGKPFNADMFLEMLEKVEIQFDRQGEPIMPSLILNPKLLEKIKDTKLTKEQEERKNKILEAKKQDYYAKKRYRKLSYIN